MKKSNLLILVLIIALLLSTTIFFGFNLNKTNLELLSFIFIILNEILIYFFISTVMKGTLNTFSTTGISSLTFIYTVINIVINILFHPIFNSIKKLLITNISIILIYLIVLVIILIFERNDA